MTKPTNPNAQGMSRRTVLKGIGAAAAGAATVPLLHAAVDAREEAATTEVALRSAQELATRSGTTPALAPLGVIAFNRIAFGPRTAEDLQRMLTMNDETFVQFVDEQLNPGAIDDSEVESRLAARNFFTLNKSLEQLWLDHKVNGNTPPANFPADQSWRWRGLPRDETEQETFIRAVYSKRQLNEVLFDFWFNHFNVFAGNSSSYVAYTFVSYVRDSIRPHMLGNFRTMLEAVATSPAMLEYLDNYINQVGGPNENYAREIIELHTLGAENYYGTGLQQDVPGYPDAPVGYVDSDVYETTRIFTGWRVEDGRDNLSDTGRFTFHDPWHDRFQKTVLGQFFPANVSGLEEGRRAMDLLAAHPGTGRYICRKLCRRFISDDPPERLVNEAAAVFTAQWQAPNQLWQVMRVILLSPEFRSTWGQKIKRPSKWRSAPFVRCGPTSTRTATSSMPTVRLVRNSSAGDHPMATPTARSTGAAPCRCCTVGVSATT
ncbi:MAG: DUF1800 domain-containing protein [Chloroflexaceae bacterium]|nr:DUF1800 domain-containing protein [Chloroflexaceae bacterium]